MSRTERKCLVIGGCVDWSGDVQSHVEIGVDGALGGVVMCVVRICVDEHGGVWVCGVS